MKDTDIVDEDALLDEIRQYREEFAAQFNYDTHRMGDEYRRHQGKFGHDVISISRETGEVTVISKAPPDPDRPIDVTVSRKWEVKILYASAPKLGEKTADKSH